MGDVKIPNFDSDGKIVKDLMPDQSDIYAPGAKVADDGNGPNVIVGGFADDAIANDVSSSVILNGGGAGGNNNIIGGDGSATVGTGTTNAMETGTNASVSVVGGYDNVAGALSSKIIADHSYVGTDATVGHNAIFGGANNIIDGAGTGHAGIFSGYNCHVSASYAFAEGWLNTVSGVAAVAMGDHNTVSGTRGVAVGANNTVAGSYGHAQGDVCEVTSNGAYAAAEGLYAFADNLGYRVQASGRLATAGDAQTGVATWYLQTTDAATASLEPGGTTLYWSMERSQTVAIEALVVCRSADGTIGGAWRITGAAHWEATGSSALLGTPTVTEIYSSDAGLAVALIGSSSAGQLRLNVTGLAATNINWMARATLVQVGMAA